MNFPVAPILAVTIGMLSCSNTSKGAADAGPLIIELPYDGAAVPLANAPKSSPGAAVSTTAAKTPERKITILTTGGAIVGGGPSGEYGYKSDEFRVDDVIKAVPNIDKLAQLTGERIANIGSQDMNDQIWIKLAIHINQLLDSRNVDGVVVTHGTDTLEETAYFLNLVVKNEKPVVLVGSIRPATAVSADGPANLYNAVAVAAGPNASGRGVVVVMNEKIHSARDTTKMNTTNVETFESPNRGPVGLVNAGKIIWFQRVNKKHTRASEFNVDANTKLPRVDIVYAHASMDASLIKDAVDNGAKGIVIAGVGDGNMSKEAIDVLAVAVKSGIVVVRSTRVPTGVVLPNGEVNDDELGFVASGELNPPKSRVLLQLALLKPRDPKQVQRLFNEY